MTVVAIARGGMPWRPRLNPTTRLSTESPAERPARPFQLVTASASCRRSFLERLEVMMVKTPKPASRTGPIQEALPDMADETLCPSHTPVRGTVNSKNANTRSIRSLRLRCPVAPRVRDTERLLAPMTTPKSASGRIYSLMDGEIPLQTGASVVPAWVLSKLLSGIPAACPAIIASAPVSSHAAFRLNCPAGCSCYSSFQSKLLIIFQRRYITNLIAQCNKSRTEIDELKMR